MYFFIAIRVKDFFQQTPPPLPWPRPKRKRMEMEKGAKNIDKKGEKLDIRCVNEPRRRRRSKALYAENRQWK